MPCWAVLASCCGCWDGPAASACCRALPGCCVASALPWSAVHKAMYARTKQVALVPASSRARESLQAPVRCRAASCAHMMRHNTVACKTDHQGAPGNCMHVAGCVHMHAHLQSGLPPRLLVWRPTLSTTHDVCPPLGHLAACTGDFCNSASTFQRTDCIRKEHIYVWPCQFMYHDALSDVRTCGPWTQRSFTEALHAAEAPQHLETVAKPQRAVWHCTDRHVCSVTRQSHLLQELAQCGNRNRGVQFDALACVYAAEHLLHPKHNASRAFPRPSPSWHICKRLACGIASHAELLPPEPPLCHLTEQPAP